MVAAGQEAHEHVRAFGEVELNTGPAMTFRATYDPGA